MSRAERRAYQRMTKNQDPRALPVNPAQKARAERIAQRRAAARSVASAGGGRAYWTRAAIVAAIIAVIGFSLAWPNGLAVAAAVGIAALLVVLLLAFVLRSALGRAADAAGNVGARR
jgi:hypothetical protein